MPAVVQYIASTTPNPQIAVMDPSTVDKKRNKLGYHRTSVACVHCRRRKIRCLVAADDVQGRCENCIRLCKECQFFPVDQQPPIEKKSRPNSRIETASTDPSTASSSPPTVGEQTDAFFAYQPIALSPGQDVAPFNGGAYPGFAPDAMPTLDPSVPWDEFTTIAADPQMLAAAAAAGSMSATRKPTLVNMPPGVWSPTPPPMPPMPPMSLPGAPTVPSQSQPLSPASPYAVQPDGSLWHVAPPRAMTFPAPPDLTSSPYGTPGASFAQPRATDLKRRMTNPGFPGGPDLQGGPVPVSYPGQPAAMGYPSWPDVMVQYPVYTADVPEQAGFNNAPMGHHPSHGQPQGS